MRAVLKILGMILIGIGVVILLAGMSAASDALGLIILLLMGGIPVALGVLCMLKSRKKPEQSGTNVPDQPTIPPMPAPKPMEPDQIIEEQPAAVPAAPEPEQDPYKYYSFKVAGISFYEKDIIDTLAIENDDYDMTKKEIVDAYMADEDIYKYMYRLMKLSWIQNLTIHMIRMPSKSLLTVYTLVMYQPRVPRRSDSFLKSTLNSCATYMVDLQK